MLEGRGRPEGVPTNAAFALIARLEHAGLGAAVGPGGGLSGL